MIPKLDIPNPDALKAEYGLGTNHSGENNDPTFSQRSPFEGVPVSEIHERYQNRNFWVRVEQKMDVDSSLEETLARLETEPPSMALLNQATACMVALAYQEKRSDVLKDEAHQQLFVRVEAYMLETDDQGTRVRDSVALSRGEGNDFDRACLAFVLASKLAGNPYTHEIEFDGVTFSRYIPEQHSYRDRMEYFVQQGRKYGYVSGTVEQADLFLLHTRAEGEPKTRYLIMQEKNLATARKYIHDSADFRYSDPEGKPGGFDLKDIRDIQELLLRGLVPKGCERMLRDEEATVGNRMELIMPDFIRSDTDRLFANIEATIQERSEYDYRDPIDTYDMVAMWVVAYDVLHPTKDSNSRIETLMAEDLLSKLTGRRIMLDIPRSETKRYADAITASMDGYVNCYQLLAEVGKKSWYKTKERERFSGLGAFLKEHSKEYV